jgi:hypothetical protein
MHTSSNIGIDRLNGREKDRLYPEFVNRRNEHPDVVSQHLTQGLVDLPTSPLLRAALPNFPLIMLKAVSMLLLLW